MKKVLTMSMVAAIAVAGNAFAAERDTRMSDIVRLLEDNPEMMAEVESDIATRAALKVPTTKVVSLKKTTPSTNGLYNTISGPSLGSSNGSTTGGSNGMVKAWEPETIADINLILEVGNGNSNAHIACHYLNSARYVIRDKYDAGEISASVANGYDRRLDALQKKCEEDFGWSF